MELIRELCNKYNNENFEVSILFDGVHFYVEYVDITGEVEEHIFDADLLEALEKFKKLMEYCMSNESDDDDFDSNDTEEGEINDNDND